FWPQPERVLPWAFHNRPSSTCARPRHRFEASDDRSANSLSGAGSLRFLARRPSARMILCMQACGSGIGAEMLCPKRVVISSPIEGLETERRVIKKRSLEQAGVRDIDLAAKSCLSVVLA